MRKTIAALALLACTAASPAPIRTLDGHKLTPAAIDGEVGRLMTAAKVTGLGVALIRDGRVVFAKSYGKRDTAQGLPLETDTVMYGASLTKATFAWYLMQLVDEGRIDLDRPIAGYLPRPLPEYQDYADLAGDPRWHQLTFRILLDHSSGFANLRRFEPTRSSISTATPAPATAIRARGWNWPSSSSKRALASIPRPKCSAASSIASACTAPA